MILRRSAFLLCVLALETVCYPDTLSPDADSSADGGKFVPFTYIVEIIETTSNEVDKRPDNRGSASARDAVRAHTRQGPDRPYVPRLKSIETSRITETLREEGHDRGSYDHKTYNERGKAFENIRYSNRKHKYGGIMPIHEPNAHHLTAIHDAHTLHPMRSSSNGSPQFIADNFASKPPSRNAKSNNVPKVAQPRRQYGSETSRVVDTSQSSRYVPPVYIPKKYRADNNYGGSVQNKYVNHEYNGKPMRYNSLHGRLPRKTGHHGDKKPNLICQWNLCRVIAKGLRYPFRKYMRPKPTRKGITSAQNVRPTYRTKLGPSYLRAPTQRRKLAPPRTSTSTGYSSQGANQVAQPYNQMGQSIDLMRKNPCISDTPTFADTTLVGTFKYKKGEPSWYKNGEEPQGQIDDLRKRVYEPILKEALCL